MASYLWYMLGYDTDNKTDIKKETKKHQDLLKMRGELMKQIKTQKIRLKHVNTNDYCIQTRPVKYRKKKKKSSDYVMV